MRGFDDPRARNQLAALLEDENDQVRLEAALGLSKFSDPRAAKTLWEAIGRTRSHQLHVRRELYKAYRFVPRAEAGNVEIIGRRYAGTSALIVGLPAKASGSSTRQPER